MVIRDGEHVIPVWTSWMSPHMYIPEIYCADYDNDGVYEYAIKTHMATGLGLSGDELYMVEADYTKDMNEAGYFKITEYRRWVNDIYAVVNDYIDDTGNIVTITLNGETVATIDLSGHFEKHKQYNESYSGIGYGTEYSFTENDGTWNFTCKVSIYTKSENEKSSYSISDCPDMELNARVVYEPDQQFHLEDIEITVEERNGYQDYH